jgi:hypothetical protein
VKLFTRSDTEIGGRDPDGQRPGIIRQVRSIRPPGRIPPGLGAGRRLAPRVPSAPGGPCRVLPTGADALTPLATPSTASDRRGMRGPVTTPNEQICAPMCCASFPHQQLHESGHLNDMQQRGRRVDDSKCQARLRPHRVSGAQQCS